MKTATKEIENKVKQVVDTMYKNLIENEAKKKAVDYVEKAKKELAASRSDDAERRAKRQKSFINSPCPHPEAIFQCGPIPKIADYQDNSPVKLTPRQNTPLMTPIVPTKPTFVKPSPKIVPSPKIGPSPKIASMPFKEEKKAKRKSNVGSDDSSSKPQMKPMDTLKCFMKRIEELEENTQFKDETLITELIKYLPALRRQAAKEGSKEWLEFKDKQYKDFEIKLSENDENEPDDDSIDS